LVQKFYEEIQTWAEFTPISSLDKSIGETSRLGWKVLVVKRPWFRLS